MTNTIEQNIGLLSVVNPKCMAELSVLCNLEDLDFNRAIYPTR